MKTFVVGANGQVARHFAYFVKNEKDIEEVAMIRNTDQKPFFDERGIETVHLDLVKDSIDDIAHAMKGTDAVLFSAGAGGSGYNQTVLIDLDGAIKAMIAAEQAGIKRFVMVSTFRTGREEMSKDNSLQIYTIAKNYADEWLKNRTDLDWTIIHPGILVNTDGTNQIKVGNDFDINEIPRQDVARVLIEVLKNDNTIKKEFEVLAGEGTAEDVFLKL